MAERLSLHGWDRGRARTFVDRHPDLITSKGTIKMGLQDVGRISDDDWRGLVRAALCD